MSWVLRNSDSRLGQRLVLLVLADHAKDDGTSAWPSTDTIASEARMSSRQVQRCLDALERDGHIRDTGRSRAGTVIWAVNMKGDNMSGVTNRAKSKDRMSPEPSLVQPSDTSLAAAPRKRAPNLVWDALSYVFGEPTTRSAQQVRGKVVASLRAAGATPDEIVARAKRWPLHFGDAAMTDLALEKHWDTLPRKPLRRTG